MNITNFELKAFKRLLTKEDLRNGKYHKQERETYQHYCAGEA